MSEPKNTTGASRPTKPDASCPECGYKRAHKINCKTGNERARKRTDETQKVVSSEATPEPPSTNQAPDKPHATRRPFNLQQALNGVALMTRDGRRASDFAVRASRYRAETFPFVAKVEGRLRWYTRAGRYSTLSEESPLDLFMADETVVESPAQETAASTAVDPLAKVVAALLRPTAEAMHAGGIKSLSMRDGKFVVQLESGQVYEGVTPERKCDTPSHSAGTSDKTADQTCVIEGKAALDQKIVNLDKFVSGAPDYAALSHVEQIRLHRQLAVMKTYSTILWDRIAAWQADS